ncbi:MAG TPA: hypothetical protein VGD02_09605 [Gemmatimonadaceae bacterium]|jgi:hypothetical protein
MIAPYVAQSDGHPRSFRNESLTFAVAGPLVTGYGASVANFAGTFSITSFNFADASAPLILTGVLDGTAVYIDGVQQSASIIDHVVTTTVMLRKGIGISAASSIYHLAAASCTIPLLDLGPIALDPLGLVAELSEIVLDISVQTGADSLLGTLLFALTNTPVIESRNHVA